MPAQAVADIDGHPGDVPQGPEVEAPAHLLHVEDGAAEADGGHNPPDDIS